MPLIHDPVPYWTTADKVSVKLYLGNVTDVLARMPAKSVQMICTSPPYWGLRRYIIDDTVVTLREDLPGDVKIIILAELKKRGIEPL